MNAHNTNARKKIVVLGGGPGGCAFVLRLDKLMKEKGLNFEITLIEAKYFECQYNACVGVLTPPLEKILKEKLDLSFPLEILKKRIFGYRLYANKNNIFLVEGENDEPTYTVRRSTFDKFMIEKVQELGINIIKGRVTGVEFVKSKNDTPHVRIYSDRDFLKADMVVGAFGMDEEMMGVFEKSTPSPSYKRPSKFMKTFITRILATPEYIEQKLGRSIYAYLFPNSIPNIEFGAISPKDEHIVINIAGKSVSSVDLERFLELPEVLGYLPSFNKEELQFFEGYFPASSAENCFGENYAVIGDATGWLRPFKGKGINTAVITGIKLAESIAQYGINFESFKKYYNDCSILREDHWHGMLVRNFCHYASRANFFNLLIDISKLDERLNNILFWAVSGHKNYKEIVNESIKYIFSGRWWPILTRNLRSENKASGVEIRKLSIEDLDAIEKIDEKITKKCFLKSIETEILCRLKSNPQSCLGAYIDNVLVGFVFGEIRGWDFNITRSGWIDIIGIDPDYQKMGIGILLLDELVNYFKNSGVNKVHTLISWDSPGLVDYLSSVKFKRGKFIHMERDV